MRAPALSLSPPLLALLPLASGRTRNPTMLHGYLLPPCRPRDCNTEAHPAGLTPSGKKKGLLGMFSRKKSGGQ